jgi:hypothetical protein
MLKYFVAVYSAQLRFSLYFHSHLVVQYLLGTANMSDKNWVACSFIFVVAF